MRELIERTDTESDRVAKLSDPTIRKSALGVSLLMLVGLLALVPFERIPSWGWDFAVFRAGSRALLSGENPYGEDVAARFSDGAELATIPRFVYAPIFAVMIAPLSLVGPAAASRIWFAANIALYLASAGLILSAQKWRPPPHEFFLLILALAAFAPLRTLVILGQSAVVLLFLVSLSYWLIVHEKPGYAGAALALSWFKPHLVLVPLALAGQRRWRTLVIFLVSLLLISLPFVSLLPEWIRALLDTRAFNLSFGCLPFSSLTALIGCFVADDILLLAFQAGSAVIAIAFVLLRLRSTGASVQMLGLLIGWVICFSLLVFDNVRVADLVLLTFPMLIALGELRQPALAGLRPLVAGALMTGYASPYLAQLFGAVTGNAVLYSLPIWYVLVPASTFAALVVSIHARSGWNETDGGARLIS